jgi:hypothetical protein
MGIKRVAFRSINRALSTFGMRLDLIELDLDSFPLNETFQNSLFRELAQSADTWLENQTLFNAVKFDTEEMVRELFFAYMKTPFRQPGGGSRFNNLLWLSILARAFNPAVIVDSGTFRGASAWALKFGAPNAEVWSFDIDMSRIELRTPGVEYREQDWTTFDFGGRLGQQTLVYFDDHLDQVRRLMEAHERNVGLTIFDDDFPVVSAVAMAHEGMAFPKIEFVLSDELRNEKEIVWKSGGRTLRWPVNVAYLDRGLNVIAATDRLPNTSLVTGLHQTPYRVVKTKPLS